MNTEEIRRALDAASTQHEWDTDGTFISWKDGHPLKGTYRQIALTQAITPEMFRNENHEADAHLIANAPTWLRSLLEENEQQQTDIEALNRIVGAFEEQQKENLEALQQLREELEQVKKERDTWKDELKQVVGPAWSVTMNNISLRSELAAKDKVLEEIAFYSIPPGKEGRAMHVIKVSARTILSQYKEAEPSET